METRTWVSPALCGCELNITAKWSADTINGKMYQHPASSPDNDTITDIQIINICPLHTGWETAVNGDPFSIRRGYMTQKPIYTPAETLYLNHWRFDGGKLTPDTCGCKIAVCSDRESGTEQVVRHEVHSKKCVHHLDDDDNHTKVFAEIKLKDDTLSQLAKDYPTLNKQLINSKGEIESILDPQVQWSFNAQRELEIVAPLTKSEKNAFTRKIAKVKLL